MTQAGRWIGMLLTAAMLAFSIWIYLGTGDWVALVFAAGSLAYGLFFISRPGGKP